MKTTTTIHIVAVCKRKLFFKTMEPLLTMNGIVLECLCDNPDDAMEILKKSPPPLPILVVDAHWKHPAPACEAMVKEFKSHIPGIKIIIITNFFDPEVVAHLAPWEVQGYMYRTSADVRTILNCITSVHEGKTCHIPQQ